MSLNTIFDSKILLQWLNKVNDCSSYSPRSLFLCLYLARCFPQQLQPDAKWGSRGVSPFLLKGFIKNNTGGGVKSYFIILFVAIFSLAALAATAGADIPPPLLLSVPTLSHSLLALSSLPLFPLIVPFLIADIKMAKCWPLMGRDIPGVSQMSALLCCNPTSVESIFLGKRGGLRSTGHRDTCSSGEAATTDQHWTWLNTDPGAQMRTHTPTLAFTRKKYSSHRLRFPTFLPATSPTFPTASPARSVMSRLMRVIQWKWGQLLP